MGFKDCIIGRIKEGKVNEQRGRQLANEYEERVNNLMAKGRSQAEAEAFADKILNKEVKRLEQKQRAMINLALKKKDFDVKLAASGKSVGEFISNELQLSAARVETVKHQLYSLLKENLDKISVNVLGKGRDYETFANAVMIGLGKNIEDPDAKALAAAIRKVNDTAHSMYEAAGGVMGKIDNYMVKQVHAKQPIVKAGFEQWSKDIKALLDFDQMLDESTGLPFTPEKFNQVLKDIYADIETNGRAGLNKAMEAGEDMGLGSGDINTRRDKSRFLQFKSPDAFMQYNNLYGVGDTGLPMLFINHMESMSRDIAVLEKLSARPNDFMRYVDKRMSVDGKTSPWQRRAAQADYRVLTSQFQAGDTDALWWQLLTGTLNVTRSAMLANGFLATLSDPAILSATMKLNGLSSTRALKFYTQHLAPRGKELSELAERTGFVNDMVQGAAIGDTRFTGESMGKGIPRVLANVMNKINGQERATVSVQRAAFYELMATIADDVDRKTPWAKLGEDFKINAEAYGITEADWSDILKMPIYNNGKGRFLISADVRADKELINVFKESFPDLRGQAKETAAKARIKELADKIDDWGNSLSRIASTEPTLRTKSLTTGAIAGTGIGPGGSGGAATIERAVGATLGLFKSFPLTYTMVHLLPAMRKVLSGAAGKKEATQLAMIAIGGSIGGATTVQLKNLTQGKEVQDMNDRKFWIKSMMTGGGFGLFGDFLFADYSRFGRTPLTELGGPVVGLVDDIARATKGNFDRFADGKDTNVGRDLLKIGIRNLPLVHVWYARLMADRLLLDNLERLVDPEYDRRIRKYERKLRKETGQEFWWGPGQSTPDIVK